MAFRLKYGLNKKMSTACRRYLALVNQEQRVGMNGSGGLAVKAFPRHARDVGSVPPVSDFSQLQQALRE